MEELGQTELWGEGGEEGLKTAKESNHYLSISDATKIVEIFFPQP